MGTRTVLIERFAEYEEYEWCEGMSMYGQLEYATTCKVKNESEWVIVESE